MSAMSIGKYKVLKTLGHGAHSTIVRVLRRADDRQYALKIVPIDGPEDLKFLEQAKHEFEVAHHLNHPNLIKLYALETRRNLLFRIRQVQLLLEYVDGKTLDAIPPLGIARLVQIFEKVAAGLVYLHRRSIYHADLKPNNILLSRTGDVKIIDFGLAWTKGQQKGRVQGTPEYMAPEQAKQGIVNERTDIYNLGATMYRLVTFRLPPSVIVMAKAIGIGGRSGKPALTPVQECNATAPPALCDLIHRCLAQAPQKRPERASEIQGTLDHLAEELVKRPEDRLEKLEF